MAARSQARLVCRESDAPASCAPKSKDCARLFQAIDGKRHRLRRGKAARRFVSSLTGVWPNNWAKHPLRREIFALPFDRFTPCRNFLLGSRPRASSRESALDSRTTLPKFRIAGNPYIGPILVTLARRTRAMTPLSRPLRWPKTRPATGTPVSLVSHALEGEGAGRCGG